MRAITSLSRRNSSAQAADQGVAVYISPATQRRAIASSVFRRSELLAACAIQHSHVTLKVTPSAAVLNGFVINPPACAQISDQVCLREHFTTAVLAVYSKVEVCQLALRYDKQARAASATALGEIPHWYTEDLVPAGLRNHGHLSTTS